MGIGGWISGLVSLVYLTKDKRLRADNPAFHVVWIFWVGLIAYVGLSLFNPSFKWIEWPGGGSFVANKYFDWFPTVVSTRVSAPMVLQFTGSIILAWSVLAIVERSKKGEAAHLCHDYKCRYPKFGWCLV